MGANQSIPDYWPSSQALLGNSFELVKKLKTLDKDNIASETMDILRAKYFSNEGFNVESVSKCTKACAGLCNYMLMVEQYDRVSASTVFLYRSPYSRGVDRA